MKNFLVAFLLLLSTPAIVFGQSFGVNALVQESTDVIVVEVKSTQPRKAIEGARDTAEL